ncbi:hypothetical protein FA15DRAFT_689251 [Coprinopsis marcescibilis]|uniref:T6SS Phospholipase effector Tle1-like catalytic domain-containing protein n=1 Tax=Coprinopsis marcescibilis TaxID=230819 RepID=A0A5C3KJQ8_COPMA|nr:hypothetical protein FA15DRAFT_689251 [Coprinopsis marcescibilis]
MPGTPQQTIAALAHAATIENSLLLGAESSHRTPSPHSPNGTPNKSPRRLNTDPELASSNELRLRVSKRLILCCDGTWQDGIGEHRSVYTNVLRLARTIHHADERYQPPIPQIVFYQSGIGTEKNFYSEYIEGTTGGSLADKVEEAYAFIAHNYNPGDEIFLFGFSRGAYTARMVAMFIGEIGVLDRKEMDHFAKIFIAFQKLGKANKQEDIAVLREELHPWCNPKAAGRLRADVDGDTFNVKCVGVFDTVGSLGLPESLTIRFTKVRTIFGFPDRKLGEHVERAYQALALHEMRADFNCNVFEQTEKGKLKGQTLKQCWFTGAHTDIGGGYKEHDLADVALFWMAANIEDIIALDLDYLGRLPQPVAPWGQQKPHENSSKTGIFFLAQGIQRELPTEVGGPLCQMIHPSVLEQAKLFPALDKVLRDHPNTVCPLLPLEEQMKASWPYVADSPVVKRYTDELEDQLKGKPAASATSGLVRSASSKLGKTRSLFRSFSLTRKSAHKPPADEDSEHDITIVEQRVTFVESRSSSDSRDGTRTTSKLVKKNRRLSMPARGND